MDPSSDSSASKENAGPTQRRTLRHSMTTCRFGAVPMVLVRTLELSSHTSGTPNGAMRLFTSFSYGIDVHSLN
jgi:hypothetical protein